MASLIIIYIFAVCNHTSNLEKRNLACEATAKFRPLHGFVQLSKTSIIKIVMSGMRPRYKLNKFHR